MRVGFSLGRMVLAVASAVVLAAVGGGTAAQAGRYGPGTDGARGGLVLLGVEPSTVQAEVPTWVSSYWLARSTVCDFRLTVRAFGAEVSYPGNTGTYSSFYRDDHLAADEADYAAFQVTAPAGVHAVPVYLWTSYILPRHGYRPGGQCTGTTVTRTVAVRLGVRPDQPAGLWTTRRLPAW